MTSASADTLEPAAARPRRSEDAVVDPVAIGGRVKALREAIDPNLVEAPLAALKRAA